MNSQLQLPTYIPSSRCWWTFPAGSSSIATPVASSPFLPTMSRLHGNPVFITLASLDLCIQQFDRFWGQGFWGRWESWDAPRLVGIGWGIRRRGGTWNEGGTRGEGGGHRARPPLALAPRPGSRGSPGPRCPRALHSAATYLVRTLPAHERGSSLLWHPLCLWRSSFQVCVCTVHTHLLFCPTPLGSFRMAALQMSDSSTSASPPGPVS